MWLRKKDLAFCFFFSMKFSFHVGFHLQGPKSGKIWWSPGYIILVRPICNSMAASLWSRTQYTFILGPSCGLIKVLRVTAYLKAIMKVYGEKTFTGLGPTITGL